MITLVLEASFSSIASYDAHSNCTVLSLLLSAIHGVRPSTGCGCDDAFQILSFLHVLVYSAFSLNDFDWRSTVNFSNVGGFDFLIFIPLSGF